jgi:hypothetical protein
MTVRILRWTTGCVAAVSVALLAGGIALSYANRHLVPASGWDFSSVFEEATFMVVPAVGFVLASRRPGNRIGWIFLGAGLVLGLGFFCQRYGQRGLIAAPGSLPAAQAAAWFVNWAWQIAAAGLAFILLLFPTGRLRSRRWRPAAWFVAAVFTLDEVSQVVRAGRLWADPLAPLGDGWYPGLRTAILILVPAALLVGAAAVAVRFAGSSGEERLQLKWFAMAALLVIAVIIPLALAPQIGLSPNVASRAVAVLKVAFGLALVCVYAAIAIAVLKYRLYDIDRVISRTLAYAIVTGVLAGVYAGLVLLATQVFRVHAPVAVAAATLAAAALFAPVRRRVQQRVDRRFNRARYDADQTVAAFAAHLKDAVDLDTICEDLARAVQTALEPAHVSVWTRRLPVASFPLQVAGGHPAVDQQRGAGDEPGLVAGVEHRCPGHVAGLADPADRRHRPVTRALFISGIPVLLTGCGHVPHARPDVTRAQHVRTDAVRAAVQREHLAQHDHGGLGHRVQARGLLAPDPRIGGNVDHAPAAPGQVRVGVLCI